VDAITYTSAHAVANLLALAGPQAAQVKACLAQGDVTVACVGPVTAGAASAAGAADLVVAKPARLGAMVRALSQRMADRAQHLELAGVEVVVQGARLCVGGQEVRLPSGSGCCWSSCSAPKAPSCLRAACLWWPGRRGWRSIPSKLRSAG
jgi:uroporphyrinogen-III synthase